MKSFEYERAQSLQDAAALKTAAENAEFMAGGTDLLGKIKKEILPVPTSVVVDIKGLEEAKGVELKDGVLSIGALTTLAGLCENETVGRTFPGLAEAESDSSLSVSYDDESRELHDTTALDGF